MIRKNKGDGLLDPYVSRSTLLGARLKIKDRFFPKEKLFHRSTVLRNEENLDMLEASALRRPNSTQGPMRKRGETHEQESTTKYGECEHIYQLPPDIPPPGKSGFICA